MLLKKNKIRLIRENLWQKIKTMTKISIFHPTKIAFLISFLFVGFQANSQKKISLDEDWRFHFGNAADVSKDFDYG
jgi:beta-galactosidase